ncbi:hypothetical protein EDD28_2486 [Salana multivorans]|uniref:3-methyladenine DNA glycosylase n=1 Tax=Salana multivorans TaxID=120377 RepID=A0A3N2CZX6_9MICO|nr:3-methyladenine DNA glycosylase [Salana multivorans]ROR93081.1 hypothetical protein EDD28_2486 [Salana multivorans]
MSPTLTLLPRGAWTARAEAHARRADALTAGHRERRAAGSSHAVEDFLYTYYPLRPAVLRRWSPGAGVALADAAGSPVASARWFTTEGDAVRLDGRAYLADRGGAVRHHATLLAAVADRPPVFSCFGLHEWAIVYREPAGAHRHALPLRLGEAGTDAVVERHQITCSHYDAFRFFTPEATGRNELRPTRELQVELDQPGCLHVGMDLVIRLGCTWHAEGPQPRV